MGVTWHAWAISPHANQRTKRHNRGFAREAGGENQCFAPSLQPLVSAPSSFLLPMQRGRRAIRRARSPWSYRCRRAAQPTSWRVSRPSKFARPWDSRLSWKTVPGAPAAHRHGAGVPVRARRLHNPVRAAAHLQHRPCGQPEDLVRSSAIRAGQRARVLSGPADRAPRPPGQQHRGIDRQRQGQSRQAQRWLAGRGRSDTWRWSSSCTWPRSRS